MLTVNLISARRAEQTRYRQIGNVLIRIIVFAGLAAVAYILFGTIASRRISNEIQATQLQKVSFQKQADEVHRLRAANSALQPRVDLVQKTGRRLDHWRYLYSQIARSLPDTVRLVSIDATTKEGAQNMKITGQGNSAHAVAKTLLSLNAQPGFSDLTMGPVQMAVPHLATLDATVAVKPLPEDAPPPTTTPATTAGTH
jgi:Tfp pilus assembly protein PilN